MKLKDLKKNELNPRKITDERLEALKRSIEELGDLGGIIYNSETKRLVGGHQRSSALSPEDKIKIEKRYDKPTRTGTIAEGYVTHKDERYAYREVSWTKEQEKVAMLSANKHGGEWDKEVLSVVFADITDLGLTGFVAPELEAMNISVPSMVMPSMAPSQTDGQYLANEEKSNEQIPTANPNENVKADFSDLEEKKGKSFAEKRFVIIVDCKDEDHKESLKELLRPIIEESEAKIF